MGDNRSINEDLTKDPLKDPSEKEIERGRTVTIELPGHAWKTNETFSKTNEDRAFVMQMPLYINFNGYTHSTILTIQCVLDGMSNTTGVEFGSELAQQVLISIFQEIEKMYSNNGIPIKFDELKEYIKNELIIIHEHIVNKNLKATTINLSLRIEFPSMLKKKDILIIFNIGDSRTVSIDFTKLIFDKVEHKTTDDLFVYEMIFEQIKLPDNIDIGKLTIAFQQYLQRLNKEHPFEPFTYSCENGESLVIPVESISLYFEHNNILNNALGLGQPKNNFVYLTEIPKTAILITMTDGVHELINDRELLEIFRLSLNEYVKINSSSDQILETIIELNIIASIYRKIEAKSGKWYDDKSIIIHIPEQLRTLFKLMRKMVNISQP